MREGPVSVQDQRGGVRVWHTRWVLTPVWPCGRKTPRVETPQLLQYVIQFNSIQFKPIQFNSNQFYLYNAHNITIDSRLCVLNCLSNFKVSFTWILVCSVRVKGNRNQPESISLFVYSNLIKLQRTLLLPMLCRHIVCQVLGNNSVFFCQGVLGLIHIEDLIPGGRIWLVSFS